MSFAIESAPVYLGYVEHRYCPIIVKSYHFHTCSRDLIVIACNGRVSFLQPLTVNQIKRDGKIYVREKTVIRLDIVHFANTAARAVL